MSNSEMSAIRAGDVNVDDMKDRLANMHVNGHGVMAPKENDDEQDVVDKHILKNPAENARARILPPDASVVAKAMSIVAQWQSTGDFEYCIQLKDLLAATEKAGKQRLLTSYVHLTMFMDPKESVDEECIEQALMEIKIVWPDLKNDFNSANMQAIRKCLVFGQLKIRYSHIRMFLVECARTLRLKGAMAPTNEIAASIGKEVSDHILHLVGIVRPDLQTGEPLGHDACVELMERSAKQMDHVVEHWNHVVRNMATLAGDISLGASLEDIFNVLASTLDSGVANICARQIYQYAAHDLQAGAKQAMKSSQALAQFFRDVASTARKHSD